MVPSLKENLVTGIVVGYLWAGRDIGKFATFIGTGRWACIFVNLEKSTFLNVLMTITFWTSTLTTLPLYWCL